MWENVTPSMSGNVFQMSQTRGENDVFFFFLILDSDINILISCYVHIFKTKPNIISETITTISLDAK